MAYRLITTIQVYEGDSHETKPVADVKPGSRLTEFDSGKEFKAELVGTNTEISWIEITDSQLTALGSQLVSLNRNSECLLAEMKRSNLIAERGYGLEVSVGDVEG